MVFYKSNRFACKVCANVKGSVIDLVMQIRNVSFNEAVQYLAGNYCIETKNRYRPPDITRNTARDPGTKGRQAPPDLWQEKGKEFIHRCQKTLWGEFKGNYLKADKREAEQARQWLKDVRGLSDTAIRAAGLGWNTRDLYFESKAWGVEREISEKTGKPKKIWAPKGLIIPSCRGKEIDRIRIRRPEPDEIGRYILLPGSDARPMILEGDTIKAIVIVESDLDAFLLHDRAGDLISVVALGSATIRPDTRTDKLLKAADVILNALDTDGPGATEVWGYWKDHYPNAKRWPCLDGKDPGGMEKAGHDVRLWIEAGLILDSGTRKDPETEPGPKQKTGTEPEQEPKSATGSRQHRATGREGEKTGDTMGQAGEKQGLPSVGPSCQESKGDPEKGSMDPRCLNAFANHIRPYDLWRRTAGDKWTCSICHPLPGRPGQGEPEIFTVL